MTLDSKSYVDLLSQKEDIEVKSKPMPTRVESTEERLMIITKPRIILVALLEDDF